MEKETLVEKLEYIGKRLYLIDISIRQGKNSIQSTFIDNEDFIRLMKISKRTAQNWRDSGTIAFSQIGNKIYYKSSDIEDLLRKNYNLATK